MQEEREREWTGLQLWRDGVAPSQGRSLPPAACGLPPCQRSAAAPLLKAAPTAGPPAAHAQPDLATINNIIITCFSCQEARSVCRRTAGKGCQIGHPLESSDPCKTQITVGTMLSICTVPR